MTLGEIGEALAHVTFLNYVFHAKEDGRGSWYLQATYMEPDIVTGVPELQYTRRWPLSPQMTKSEVEQTALKLVLTSVEHRAREHFKYRGRRVYGPHFDVDELWAICLDKNLDYRRDA